jgi:predicted Zn-dependent protease
MQTRRTLQAAALLFLGACITDPVTGSSKFGLPTSDAEEGQMGASYRPIILQQFSGAYPDEALQSYLGGVVLGMAGKSVRPDMPWSFTVLNTSDVNAFAVPGGELFITRGLLWRLDDEAEFAVVMGHEIGHVEHRHSVQGMLRDQAFAVLATELSQRYIGAREPGDLLASLGIAAFSRDQERESDVRGVHHSYAAGYDPRRGAEVFRKFLALKQAGGAGGDPFEGWTSSHPLDAERIESIARLSAEKDERLAGDAPVAGLRVQTDRFTALNAKLREEQKVYDRHDAALAQVGSSGGSKDAVRAATAEFEACAKALPTHALLATTAGKAHLASGDASTAKGWFEKASALNQGLLEPEYALGMIALDGKRFDEAVSYADRGLAILPGNYACLFVRGEGNHGLGRASQAQADFQAVMESAPPESPEYKGAAARLGGAAQPQK